MSSNALLRCASLAIAPMSLLLHVNCCEQAIAQACAFCSPFPMPMSDIPTCRQLSSRGGTTPAASRALPALPHSFGSAAFTHERFVSRRSAAIAGVFASAASFRLLDALTAERTCSLVVSHGTAGWRSLVKFVFLAAGWRDDTVRAKILDHLTIVIEAVAGG